MKLSKRMLAVCDLVKPTEVVADVGCDHGYVSMELVERGICKKSIAMDLRSGPLSQARLHVGEACLTDRIECRLSDGLQEVREREANTIVIAGMGGILTKRILEDGYAKWHPYATLVLQPQSEIGLVRQYLRRHGYRIEEERVLKEDGKFYTAMRGVWIGDTEDEIINHGDDVGDVALADAYGAWNIAHPSSDFVSLLREEYRILTDACAQLDRASATARILERREALEEKLNKNRRVWQMVVPTEEEG